MMCTMLFSTALGTVFTMLFSMASGMEFTKVFSMAFGMAFGIICNSSGSSLKLATGSMQG